MTQPDTPTPDERPPGTEAPESAGDGPERADQPTQSLRDAVVRIGWEMDHSETWIIPPGDVAALRRARPGEIGGPAFWKIAVRHLEPARLLPGIDHPDRDAAERRWTAILGGMAEMAGLHQRGVRPGRALARNKVAEARVLRLLKAEGEALLDLVRTIAHQLKSQGARVDWTDLAGLVHWGGHPAQDSVRRRIALDYYSHLNR